MKGSQQFWLTILLLCIGRLIGLAISNWDKDIVKGLCTMVLLCYLLFSFMFRAIQPLKTDKYWNVV